MFYDRRIDHERIGSEPTEDGGLNHHKRWYLAAILK
jgi:hypothetical protein